MVNNPSDMEKTLRGGATVYFGSFFLGCEASFSPLPLCSTPCARGLSRRHIHVALLGHDNGLSILLFIPHSSVGCPDTLGKVRHWHVTPNCGVVALVEVLRGGAHLLCGST